ncbi:MAG: hypothetical protein ABSD76_00485 [Terriglobales bacterium]|jgi:hypothetical protein
MTLIYAGGQVGLVQSANTLTVSGAPEDPDSTNYFAAGTNSSTGQPVIVGAGTIDVNNQGPYQTAQDANYVIEIDSQTLPPSGNSPATWNYDNSLGSTAKYLRKLNNANIGTQP